MRVRPLLAVVFGAAENEAFVGTRCQRSNVNGNVGFSGDVTNPVVAAARDADVAEDVTGFTDQGRLVVVQASGPHIALAILVGTGGDKDGVCLSDPGFVAGGPRCVRAIHGIPCDAFTVGFECAKVDFCHIGHFVCLDEDAVVAIERELLVLEMVVVSLGKCTGFTGGEIDTPDFT